MKYYLGKPLWILPEEDNITNFVLPLSPLPSVFATPLWPRINFHERLKKIPLLHPGQKVVVFHFYHHPPPSTKKMMSGSKA